MSLSEIYGLFHPVSGELRYIGKARDASARLKSHVRDSHRRSTPVYSWMRSLAAEGLRPQMQVLMVAWNWREAEMALIAQARADGERLLNLAPGGDEPLCSKATRSANGRKVAAIRRSDPIARRIWEMKRFIGAAARSGTLREETRVKLRRVGELAPHVFGSWRFL